MPKDGEEQKVEDFGSNVLGALSGMMFVTLNSEIGLQTSLSNFQLCMAAHARGAQVFNQAKTRKQTQVKINRSLVCYQSLH
jgi:hypothetical protein